MFGYNKNISFKISKQVKKRKRKSRFGRNKSSNYRKTRHLKKIKAGYQKNEHFLINS